MIQTLPNLELKIEEKKVGTTIPKNAGFSTPLTQLEVPSPYLTRLWQISKFYIPMLIVVEAEKVGAEEAFSRNPFVVELWVANQLIYATEMDEPIGPAIVEGAVTAYLFNAVLSADLVTPISYRGPSNVQIRIRTALPVPLELGEGKVCLYRFRAIFGAATDASAKVFLNASQATMSYEELPA